MFSLHSRLSLSLMEGKVLQFFLSFEEVEKYFGVLGGVYCDFLHTLPTDEELHTRVRIACSYVSLARALRVYDAWGNHLDTFEAL